MKKNKKFFGKILMLVCLIVICLTSFVYAGDAYIYKETKVFGTGEDFDGDGYDENQRVDISYVVIPLETNANGDLVGTIGGVNVTVGESSFGSRDVTTTAADGSSVSGLKVSIPNADGTEISNALPDKTGLAGSGFTYSDDVDGNGTPGLMLSLSSQVVDGDSVYVVYTDGNGVEQKVLLGEAGNDLTFDDESHEVPNDINDAIENAGSGFTNLITGVFEAVASFIEEILVELFLPLGDGIVYFISASIGEVVTTDSLIFNRVDKLNINYWVSGGSTSIKGILRDVVNKWYAVFFKIAVIAYMMTLVVAGIQILLHSTAEKKAQYKEYFVSWIIGVGILCLFPYAMKYVVLLNETAVTAVSGASGNIVTTNSTPAILNDKDSANKLFGEPEFVTEMVGDSTNDSMFYIRAKAQESKKLILVIIYFILIGQMMVILLMYYKRAFMIAFLVTIFPLVAMTYAIDRMGDKKAQSFSIWFKEFIVNVVVQLFHAIVYVIVVNTTINTFVSTGGKNWLFMLISILFLFQGEKILRSIFSVQSKANTIGDLAVTAATYTAMTSFLKGGGKDNIASKQDAADSEAIKQRTGARAGWGIGGMSTVNAIDAQGDFVKSPSPSTQGPENAGQFRGKDNDPDGVNTSGFDSSAALDKVTQDSIKHRLKNGLASKGVKVGGSIAGGLIGATYGASKGDTGGNLTSNVVQGTHLGKEMSKGITSPISGAVNVLERRNDGNKLAEQIRSGELDKALNLEALMEVVPPDINVKDIVDKNGEDMQSIYREALAEAAKAGSRGGRAKAEAAYWNYIRESFEK